jgi:hypothetical protein
MEKAGKRGLEERVLDEDGSWGRGEREVGWRGGFGGGEEEAALEADGGGDQAVPVGVDALGRDEEGLYVEVEEDCFEELVGGED